MAPYPWKGRFCLFSKRDHLLYGKIFDAFFLDIGLPEDYFWIDKHPEHLLPKDNP